MSKGPKSIFEFFTCHGKWIEWQHTIYDKEDADDTLARLNKESPGEYDQGVLVPEAQPAYYVEYVPKEG